MRDSLSWGQWIAKRAARAGICVAGCAVTKLSLRTNQAFHVLMYHRFGHRLRDPYVLSPEMFETQMARLASHGVAISLADVEAWLRGEASIEPGSVLVTIDDGDPTVHSKALPILGAYGIPAVVYTLGGRPDGWPTMSDKQLIEIDRAGLTIASHTNSHRNLNELPTKDMIMELRDSKDRLEQVIGKAITSVAYPFGTPLHVSPRVADCAREMGYTTGFTSIHGGINIKGTQHPLLLPRVKVESGDPSWMFEQSCHGALNLWRFLDHGVSWLRRGRETMSFDRQAAM